MKITHCNTVNLHSESCFVFFVLEVTAHSVADILGIQSNSAMFFYRKIRQVIACYLALQADEVFDGSIEPDESYFGGQRKGKLGRGAAGKAAVFGILKRNGKVYTVVVENTKQDTLLPVIKRKIMPDSIVYTDCYKSCDVLDVSEFIHHRINHSQILQSVKTALTALRISGTKQNVF